MPADVATSFGALLRRSRLAAGLTQEALAERAGLSARGVQELEHGTRLPLADTVQRLTAALALTGADRAAFARAGEPRPRQRAGRSAPAAGRYALPAELTSFVGRGRELDTLHGLLFTTRLLTLTGPGGVGKTRLAVRLAAAVARDYPDGVTFVSLADLTDPALVLPAVARAFGVQPGRQDVGATLAELLRRRKLLLVLDNCEQVAGAAPALGALLTACPHLTILATSRSPLRLAAEQEFAAPPLALPPNDTHTPQEIAAVEAVALFVARARAVRPDFALTDDNAAAVAAICRRLDGLPLALELAAARTRVLSPAALLDRLESRLDLLTAGPTDAPARQRALRATLAWSYDLLSPNERTLFRWLGVFVGGFTAGAAEAVGAAPGNDGAGGLDRLEVLVAHSLVRHEGADGEDGRFRMLETIGEFARERLEESGEGAAAALAHARHYLALADRAHAERAGPRLAAWLDQLDREAANVRAALSWCAAAGEAEIGLRLAAALFRFWSTRGRLGEGRAWMNRLLAEASARGTAAPATRANALQIAGSLARTQGDLPAAQALAEASLALRRSLGDAGEIAESLNLVGRVALEQGDHERAAAALRESLALADRHDSPQFAYRARHILGDVLAARGEYERAATLLREALALERARGDRFSLAWTLRSLADLALKEGDGAAAALLDESLALSRHLRDSIGIAQARRRQADLALDRGDRSAARACLIEALRLQRQVGDRGELALVLDGCRRLADQAGQAERARRLAVMAAALREAS